MNELQQEVWDTVCALNATWTTDGVPEKLVDFFHTDMVAIVPGSQKRLEGREACVAGWSQFARGVDMKKWEATEPKVQLYGNDMFAVVTYYFDMEFEMDGYPVKVAGRDMYVLVKEDGKWLAVADQYSPFLG